jgi:hypothetical protein
VKFERDNFLIVQPIVVLDLINSCLSFPQSIVLVGLIMSTHKQTHNRIKTECSSIFLFDVKDGFDTLCSLARDV